MNQDRSGVTLPPGELRPVEIDLSKAGLKRTSAASIGKKYVMAICGLIWCFFLVGHLFGNLTIFIGPEAFNAYAAKLAALGPILIVIELALVAFLLLHILFGVVTWLQNKAARPEPYEMDKAKGGRTIASSTMIWTGLVIIVFAVVHLLNLKFGEHETLPDGHIDLYSSTIALFQSVPYVIGYIVAVCLAGLHVSHGFQSSFRTLGLNHDRYTPTIHCLSTLFGWVVAIGYSAIPIWALLVKGGG